MSLCPISLNRLPPDDVSYFQVSFLMDVYVPVELQEQSHKVGVQALAGAIN